MKVAMIPARLGSQRLKQKNLCEVGGVTLLARALRKSFEADVFDEVWVNAAEEVFGEIAEAEGARFHRRPPALSTNTATSEEFVQEFLEAHPCDLLFQVHSIAPLLTAAEVADFVRAMEESDADAQLSVVLEQIECALEGEPVNFRLDRKTNSQDLRPVQRVTWSITGWRRSTYLEAFAAGGCATYAGRVAFFPISRPGGHIIKTAEDLRVAEALLSVLEKP